jgi:hypothetical protein
MLNISTGTHRTCDGVTRRDILRAGTLSLGGLTLADAFRGQARAAEAISGKTGGGKSNDLNVILFWQGGGPSHIDMWDLKPQAAAEFRGTFNPIQSNLPGLDICEHMPRIAAVCDKLCVIRSGTHPDAGHESASHTLLTGYKPTNDIPANEVPSYGSIVAHEKGARAAGFPAYVAVPRAPKSSAAAYLGVAYNPFEVLGDPADKNFNVRDLKLPGQVDEKRLAGRRSLLAKVDTVRRDIDRKGLVVGLDQFSEQAFDLVTSAPVRDAFDIAKEDDKLRDRYGRHTWGQSTLLARRLVERGVRFATIDIGGWDTHANNFESLKNDKLPKFDECFSALITDLDQRGMLDTTMVLVWGEFGRTPRINSGAGRDHWPNAFSVVMAGGGLKRGLVLGSSDPRAEYPIDRPVSPQDVLATMYSRLGIDRTKSFVNDAQRPVEILNYGSPIAELV